MDSASLDIGDRSAVQTASAVKEQTIAIREQTAAIKPLVDLITAERQQQAKPAK